jgi:hypothetical protein
MQSAWQQRFQTFINLYVESTGSTLGVTPALLARFNAELTFATTRPLTSKKLGSYAMPLQDAPAAYHIDSLLVVARCRGIVVSNDDWNALVANICRNRGVSVVQPCGPCVESLRNDSDVRVAAPHRSETAVTTVVPSHALTETEVVPVVPSNSLALSRRFAKLRIMLTHSNQRLRRAKATIAKRDRLIAKLKCELSTLKSRNLRRGKQGRYFSPEGGLELALRQSASLAASHSFGIAAAMHIHGSNISRWKVRLRACQILEFRTWLATVLEGQRAPIESWEQPGLCIVMRRIRQDATQSDAWKGRKLSVTELLASSPRVPIFQGMSWDDVEATVETKCILAALLESQRLALWKPK